MCEYIFHSDKEKTLEQMEQFLLNSSAPQKIIRAQIDEQQSASRAQVNTTK